MFMFPTKFNQAAESENTRVVLFQKAAESEEEEKEDGNENKL